LSHFENRSAAFSKWFGHLLKMGQPWPPFENYMAACSRWVDRSFENGSLKMSTTAESLAAKSVSF